MIPDAMVVKGQSRSAILVETSRSPEVYTRMAPPDSRLTILALYFIIDLDGTLATDMARSTVLQILSYWSQPALPEGCLECTPRG